MNRITYVDFILNVVFNYLKEFFPHEINVWPNLLRVANNVS